MKLITTSFSAPPFAVGEILLLRPGRCYGEADGAVQDAAFWQWGRFVVALGKLTELQLAEGRGHVLLLGQQQGQLD